MIEGGPFKYSEAARNITKARRDLIARRSRLT